MGVSLGVTTPSLPPSVAVTIQIDRRKTLGDLKERLMELVMVPTTEFKVHIYHSEYSIVSIFILTDLPSL